MTSETEKKATERRMQKEAERASEESFVTHFASIRNRFMGMLVARWQWRSDSALFERAQRLAVLEFCRGVEEQAEMAKALGWQFRPPALYRKFRPHQLGMAAELKALAPVKDESELQ